MKETKKLYDSISNIDHRFIEEAQKGEIRKAPAWRGRAALAACLCAMVVCAITVICAIAVVRPQKTAPVPNPGPTIGDDPESDEYSSADIVPEYPSGVSDGPESGNPFCAVFNDIDVAPVGAAAMINLAAEDFRPMSAEESLQYFGVSLLRGGGIIPGAGLERTGGGCFGDEYGVYRTEERGVYYDINSYVFTNGNKSVTLTLRTVFQNLTPSPEQVKNGPEKISFAEIKGWNLALFRYEGEDGAERVYTEFARDGVIFSITACGLENNELASALASILPQKEEVSEPRIVSGTVTHVDNRTEDYFDGTWHHYKESHDYITLGCGSICLTV